MSVRLLARVVDAKDPSTRRHSERVGGLCAEIAEELGWDTERAALLREAGLVHDVGKIVVPDAVLFAPRAAGPGRARRGAGAFDGGCADRRRCAHRRAGPLGTVPPRALGRHGVS